MSEGRKRPEHWYFCPEYGAPAVRACELMEVPKHFMRRAAVTCKECNARVRRLPPWEVYWHADSERRWNGGLYRVDRVMMFRYYSKDEPDAAWDIKTRRRLK